MTAVNTSSDHKQQFEEAMHARYHSERCIKLNSKVVTREKGNLIVEYLKSRCSPGDVEPSFRNWVKKKGFAITSYLHLNLKDVLCVPVKQVVGSPTSTNPSQSLSVWRRVAFLEDFFGIISCYHSPQSKQHLSAKRTLAELSKEYDYVPSAAIEKYVELCPICNLDQPRPSPPLSSPSHKGKSSLFMEKGQVEVIDMKSSPNGSYQWIGIYVDCWSRFSVLFPLTSRDPATIAIALQRFVFAYLGLPDSLQSSNGAIFVNVLICCIRKNLSLEPEVIIKNGNRSSHGSDFVAHMAQIGEIIVNELKKMSVSDTAKSVGGASTNSDETLMWSEQLPFIQYRINTTHFPANDNSKSYFHTPFELVYGKHAGISPPSLVGEGGGGMAGEGLVSNGGSRKEGGTSEVLSTDGKSEEESNLINQLYPPQPEEVLSLTDKEEELQDLSDNTDMQGRRIFPRQPVIELEKQEHNVTKLRELLRLEETKLQALRVKRGQQSTSTVSSKGTEAPRGGVIHSVQGSGNLQVSSGTGGKVTEEPSAESNNGGQPKPAQGISSRLQQLVDSIATNQVPSKKPATMSQPSQQLMVTTSSLINHMQTSMGGGGAQQAGGKPGPKNTSPPEVITIPDTPSPSSPPALIHNHTSSLPSAIQVPTISSAHPKQHSRSESPQLDEETIMKAVESSKKYREFLMKQAAIKRSFQKSIDKRMSTTPYPKTFRQVWPIIPVHDSSFVKNLGLEMVTMYFDPNWKTIHSKPPPATKVKPVCNQCGCDFASAWQIRKNNSKQVLLCESCDFTNLKLLQRTKLASQLKELIEEIRKEETKFMNECRDAKKQVVEMEREAILNSHKMFGKAPTVQPSVITQQSTRDTHPLYSSIQSSNHTFPRGGGALESVQKLPSKAVQVKPGLVQLPVSSEMTRAVVPSILPSQISKPFIQSPSIVSSNSMKDAAAAAAADAARKRRSPEVDSAIPPPRKLSKTSQQLDSTLDHITRQLLRKQVGEKCNKQRKPNRVQEPKSFLGMKPLQEQGSSGSTTAVPSSKPTLAVNHDPPPLAPPAVPLIDIAAPPSPPVVLKGSPMAPSDRNSPGCEGANSDGRRSRRKGKPRQNRLQSSSSNTE